MADITVREPVDTLAASSLSDPGKAAAGEMQRTTEPIVVLGWDLSGYTATWQFAVSVRAAPTVLRSAIQQPVVIHAPCKRILCLLELRGGPLARCK